MNSDDVTDKCQRTDDEIIDNVLEPQNVTSEFEDGFNDTRDNGKILLDEGNKYLKFLEP